VRFKYCRINIHVDVVEVDEIDECYILCEVLY